MLIETNTLSKRIGQNCGYILNNKKNLGKNLEDTVIMRGLKSKLKCRTPFYVDESEVGKIDFTRNEELTIEKLQFNFLNLNVMKNYSFQ